MKATNLDITLRIMPDADDGLGYSIAVCHDLGVVGMGPTAKDALKAVGSCIWSHYKVMEKVDV